MAFEVIKVDLRANLICGCLYRLLYHFLLF